MQHRLNRRAFFKTAGAAIGFPYLVPASALGTDGTVPPSERVALACLGTGNQGVNNLRAFLGDERVQVVAVCDVNEESPGYWDNRVAGREPARRIVDQHYAARRASGEYKGCETCEDYRELLARADIDAFMIALPDHWHSIPTVEAAKAGKDIYGEKPLSLTVAEGRAMSDAVKQYGGSFRRAASSARTATSAACASWSATGGSASCTPSSAACLAACPTSPGREAASAPSRYPTDSIMTCGSDRHRGPPTAPPAAT